MDHVKLNKITRGVWTLFAWSIPVTLVALVVGGALARGIAAERFERYLSVALVALGLLLIF